MSRKISNPKINNIITSAKKTFLKASMMSMAALSLNGCAMPVANIDTGNSDNIVKEAIEVKTVFEESKDFFSKTNNTIIYNEYCEEIGTLQANTPLSITGISEDGVWYLTTEGFYVKVADAAETAVSVIQSEGTLMYAKYDQVRVHIQPDKTSETINILPLNQTVLKTGDVQFGYKGALQLTDPMTGYEWSEVRYKDSNDIVVGYVYTVNLQAEESYSRKVAVEVEKVYTEEEKAALLAKATELSLEGSILTDEDVINLEKAIKLKESVDSLSPNIQVVKNKIAIIRDKDADIVGKEPDKSLAESFGEIYKMIAEINSLPQFAPGEREQLEKEEKERQAMLAAAEERLATRTECTYTCSMLGNGNTYPKGYDHAYSKQYLADLAAQEAAAEQAHNDSKGGLVEEYTEEGYWEVDGKIWTRKHTKKYGDGSWEANYYNPGVEMY